MRKRRKKTFAAVQAPAPVNLMSEPVKRKRGRPRKQRPEPGARLEIWWGIVSRTTGKLLRVYEQ